VTRGGAVSTRSSGRAPSNMRDWVATSGAYSTGRRGGEGKRGPGKAAQERSANKSQQNWQGGCTSEGLKESIAGNKGFPYYGYMNITLSLDPELVKEVRKIAVERDTTLTGLVRAYLEQIAAESAKSGRRRREREALERSFEEFKFPVGKRTWKRADLHVRN